MSELASGYPCFIFSIGSIGVVVAMIGDVASHMGCFIELKDTINAITFIAMGTALPDTFASRQAAIQVSSYFGKILVAATIRSKIQSFEIK